jgi:hypothetical protein
MDQMAALAQAFEVAQSAVPRAGLELSAIVVMGSPLSGLRRNILV